MLLNVLYSIMNLTRAGVLANAGLWGTVVLLQGVEDLKLEGKPLTYIAITALSTCVVILWKNDQKNRKVGIETAEKYAASVLKISEVSSERYEKSQRESNDRWEAQYRETLRVMSGTTDAIKENSRVVQVNTEETKSVKNAIDLIRDTLKTRLKAT